MNIFRKEILVQAREEKWPTLIALCHRKIGPSARLDTEITLSGPTTPEVCAIVYALLSWVANKKPERLAELKRLVASLEDLQP